MKTYITLTAIGEDKPGVVSRIAKVVKKNNANIDLQRGSSMAGDFAIIMSVSLDSADDKKINQLITELNGLQQGNFFIHAKKSLQGKYTLTDGYKWGQISAEGRDQIGILDKITSLLVKNDINIKTMNQDIKQSKVSEDYLFKLKGKLVVPEDIDTDQFEEHLKDIEREFNITLSFQFPIDK